MKTPATERDRLLDRFRPALTYQAPYLLEKLVADGYVATHAEAETLFGEAKRYLVLDRAHPADGFAMYSRRVDEVWHQFVLFTKQYSLFCNHFFGAYVHHEPGAPASSSDQSSDGEGFEQFRAAYAAAFGVPLPVVWLRSAGLDVDTHVLSRGRDLRVLSQRGTTQLLTGDAVVMTVNDLALAALQFITRTRSFYVRELPGALTDHEKTGLAAALVSHGLLDLKL